MCPQYINGARHGREISQTTELSLDFPLFFFMSTFSPRKQICFSLLENSSISSQVEVSHVEFRMYQSRSSGEGTCKGNVQPSRQTVLLGYGCCRSPGNRLSMFMKLLLSPLCARIEKMPTTLKIMCRDQVLWVWGVYLEENLNSNSGSRRHGQNC